jgi:hypothetical protein
MAGGPLNGNVLADGPCSADVALNTLPFNAQSPVYDRQNLSTVRINNHSFNDNQESLRSSAPTQSMSENSTSSEESTTNRLSNDPSDMTTPVDMTTTSNRAPPDGEANATTSGLAQGQSSQTIQREDSVGTNVKVNIGQPIQFYFKTHPHIYTENSHTHIYTDIFLLLICKFPFDLYTRSNL